MAMKVINFKHNFFKDFFLNNFVFENALKKGDRGLLIQKIKFKKEESFEIRNKFI
jgi:hypothetical protein